MALNCSAADFENNVDHVKSNLIASLAAAGGVSASDVVINTVVAAAGRRLLTLEGAPEPATTSIKVTLLGAMTLRSFKTHARANKILQYSWNSRYSSQSRRTLH